MATLSDSQFANMHPVLRRVYSARGVVDAKQLDYQLAHLLTPKLKGLSEAASILAAAVQRDANILIIGDYDADGATSTALAVRCLSDMGAKHVNYLVPNRFEFGYGLSPEIIEFAKALEPELIVTVDNGIASVEGVAVAKRLGYQVIVTDHHLPGSKLPNADAIVNPNQRGCEFSSKAAAGVGVIFYVMSALRKLLQEQNWFNASKPQPNMAQYLDLVALGTVADVVPLDFNNRILVAQGLQRIRHGYSTPGIAALLKVGGRNQSKVSATDMGFVVGPRLNAAGRLDDMSVGVRCLLTDDEGEALGLAQELDHLNRERRSIEASMQVDAARFVDELQSQDSESLPNALCLYQSDWHQGVIGILASRVKDKVHRPTIVFADDDGETVKGSGRSIKGVHLRDALEYVAIRQPTILKKFGGHAMAAGLTIKKNHLELFEKTFVQAVDEQLSGNEIEMGIETDGALEQNDFSLSLAETLEQAGPWGQAFPEPRFDGEFAVVQQKLVGGKHLKLVLGLAGCDLLVDAIAFGVDLDVWPNSQCKSIRTVYKLAVNEYNGKRSIQLIIDYLEPVI